MTIKHAEEYRDTEIAQKLAAQIKASHKQPIRLMEVCGTHTMSIFRHGIRGILPEGINLLSGPGCPVCVTAQGEIDAFIQLAEQDDTIVTTFGDLMRVPGTTSSLQQKRAEGRDIRIVYSTFDALDTARQNPDKKIVFLGVGFETTAPTIAAAILTARQTGVDNFSVLCAHKLVPPALEALMQAEEINVDGFILPGHVSVIIGLKAYRPFFDKYPIPAAVAGFEPADILRAIHRLVMDIENGIPQLSNEYPRAVSEEGNPKAQEILDQIFQPADAVWRGIGVIPQSGLGIKADCEAFDAEKVFAIKIPDVPEPRGCACGEILTGVKTPPECPLYKTTCSPTAPVGPCMVSSEGTCAAYYRYHVD
jgi:hydrogenase expression/formation protein HypD